MWKSQDFSATQILREINLWECVVSKSAIFLAVFKSLNLSKLISRKIWVEEKFVNFRTVWCWKARNTKLLHWRLVLNILYQMFDHNWITYRDQFGSSNFLFSAKITIRVRIFIFFNLFNFLLFGCKRKNVNSRKSRNYRFSVKTEKFYSIKIHEFVIIELY